MPRVSFGFLRGSAWLREVNAADPTLRNLTSGTLNTILRWHWRHDADALSPRTATTPGAGKELEHSAHVGMKLLGRRSAIVQPSKSR